MTNDVISDCVVGDDMIEKMPKKGEIGGSNSLKGIEPGISSRSFNESLDCVLFCV